nr:MAG TPA: hypothetical protein [Caudoviricetes sp.]
MLLILIYLISAKKAIKKPLVRTLRAVYDRTYIIELRN